MPHSSTDDSHRAERTALHTAMTVSTTAGRLPVPVPDRRWTVLFFITEPGIGEVIPELGGCTTGLCSVRDLAARFSAADAAVLGVSAHEPGALAEFARERGLGYPLVGDGALALGRALEVPEVQVGKRTLYRRATVVLGHDGRIRARFHPIPEPETHAEAVLAQLAALDLADRD
ncbi:redoxin domain-containing protein [Streptomyces sp. Adlamb9]|uniref:redoxin domain-containing protein n=1 Tax=Streptomyces sp. Adlamb9 TaxID=3400629 RepID=UPI003F1CFDDA